ncbi:ATP-binding protein, partial [Streptococcus pneumoniae]|uniref:ATP-binding protein n=1 Tax=Streptococcus pneumoniae TaxID=1313 RepID=UPI000B26EAC9
RKHRDRPIIKVVSGVRRAGKSVLFQLYKEELLATGVDEDQIIFINFEDLSYYDLRHFQTLFAYIKDQLVSKKTYYIFLDEIQTGRYVEIEVLPLSFEEYLSGQSLTENLNTTEIFNNYLFS